MIIARVFLHALVLARRAEVKARRIRTVARSFELGLPRIGRLAVEHMAIRVHGRSHIVGALRAALDFDAVDARLGKLAHMGEHVHIGGAHDEAATVFLNDRERLARARFFHDRVLPAARLRAMPIVRAARGAHHVVAHKAST